MQELLELYGNKSCLSNGIANLGGASREVSDHQVSVVQKVDNAIYRINHFPA